MDQKENKLTGAIIVDALVHFLWNFFLYFVVKMPFDLWKAATIRLSNQRKQGSLVVSNSDSKWPLFSFLYVFLFEFLFDALIFFAYLIGIIAGIYGLIDDGFLAMIAMMAGAYYIPYVVSLIRDLFQILLLPFEKFLSWISKPAQYLDLKIENKESII
ncbi:hypothetical protein KAH27_10530 [bacterium]|nr:hypothetical protein [bacterium]